MNDRFWFRTHPGTWNPNSPPRWQVLLGLIAIVATVWLGHHFLVAPYLS